MRIKEVAGGIAGRLRANILAHKRLAHQVICAHNIPAEPSA
jgi:hypothetical protein